MRYKPFLSHKRQKAAAVAYLKRQLCIRGAGGWQDTDELPMGGNFPDDIERAINEDTGGCIWWATKDTLKSEIICATELPTALDRAQTDPTYAVVPVFVDLRPGRDFDAIEAALGPAYAKQMLDRNGVLRRAKQPVRELAREAAREYVKQLVKGVPDRSVDVAVTAFRAPTERHDLTLDWRCLFDPDTRVLQPAAVETIVETLGDIREAVQSRERTPQVSVEVALPLPLAMLLGYEWRHITQLRVTVKTVNPGDGELLVVEPAAAASRSWPAPRVVELPGSGPFVVGVSVGASLGTTIDRYAAEHEGRGFEHIHVDRDPQADPLDADDVRSLAAHVVRRLNELQAAGVPKHLLLRGPASLATAIGLAANGTGPTCVPFYDGHDYYVGGLWIG
jgi:hypothetical protein